MTIEWFILDNPFYLLNENQRKNKTNKNCERGFKNRISDNMTTLLVTGGMGFIGSNFIRYMLKKYPGYKIINQDKLTYAGNPENLRDVENSEN